MASTRPLPPTPTNTTSPPSTATDIPIETGAPEDTHLGRLDTPILALSLSELMRRVEHPSPPPMAARPRIYRIEFNKRFSYPFACLVLMLVGVPLGISSKRGGKSTGFVLTILLVFIYYFLSLDRHRLRPDPASSLPSSASGEPTSSSPPPAPSFSIRCLAAASPSASSPPSASASTSSSLRLISRKQSDPASPLQLPDIATILRRFRGILGTSFPLLLDDYVMREFVTNLLLVLSSFSALFLIFTFFELIGDIIRNRTPLVTVGEYLINLIPYILYNVTPLCALVAVLITFGALNRTSELTAMKATGISLYRIVAPVLVVTILISAGLFAFDELYLPAANRRQEALRSVIKGKPAQTFLRPDRQWISGQATNRTQLHGDSDPSHPRPHLLLPVLRRRDRDVFANLTVFEFEPNTFALTRRIFASSARWDSHVNRWVFDNGWQRTFAGETIATYQPFTVSTFPEITRAAQPTSRRRHPIQEMTYAELSSYIADLKQSGFDTKRLSRPALQKDRLPPHHPRHGDPGHPLRSLHGQEGLARRHRRRHRPRHRLLGRGAASLRPWATSTPSPPSSPPGRPTSSSASPEPTAAPHPHINPPATHSR